MSTLICAALWNESVERGAVWVTDYLAYASKLAEHVYPLPHPPVLDPRGQRQRHMTTGTLTHDVAWQLYEPLFTLDENYAVIPMLAEGHSVGEGGKLYTIRLRRGVPLHDGKEMTAEEVVASVTRCGKIATVGKLFFTTVQSVQAKDRYTVELRLTSPSGIVLPSLPGANQFAAIYPKEVVEAAGDGQISESATLLKISLRRCLFRRLSLGAKPGFPGLVSAVSEGWPTLAFRRGAVSPIVSSHHSERPSGKGFRYGPLDSA